MNEQQLSKTPRTDAKVYIICNVTNFQQDDKLDAHINLANFARRLETELNEAKVESSKDLAHIAGLILERDQWKQMAEGVSISS